MKNILKKLVLVCILVAIAVGIYFVAVNASKGKKEQKVSNESDTVSKVAQSENKNSTAQNNDSSDNNTVVATKKGTKASKETKLDDGIKYSVTDEDVKADIVLKDNYFDTQIADINLNFDNYEGKTIEIEGLYFENETYTFVGRYALSNLCPTCPAGYSYFEYEWNGDKVFSLKDSESWIKVIGTLKKGNDGVDYYYIDASSIELMNEKGQETVSN